MSALLDMGWKSSIGFSISVAGEAVMERAAPVLYWRPIGQETWQRSPADVVVLSSSTDGIELDCRLDVIRMELRASRVDLAHGQGGGADRSRLHPHLPQGRWLAGGTSRCLTSAATATHTPVATADTWSAGLWNAYAC